jgi:TonB-dependent starch-binding outer membrane protein SusC
MSSDRRNPLPHSPARRAQRPRVEGAAWCLAAALLCAAAPASAQHFAVNRPATVVQLTSAAPADLDGVPTALRQPLTLQMRRVTVERALQEVMARSGVSLTYSRAVVPLDRVVSVDVDNGSVVEALRQVLGGAGVELWVSNEGRMAIVPEQAPSRPSGEAQTGTVSGVVTAAANGEPLEAATVTVQGTRLGSVTGPDGRFTIAAVPVGSQAIRATRIGFSPDSATVTVTDGQITTANFSLRPAPTQLSEVVVIGYGTTTRRELTGAVSSVSSEDIARQPVQSVDQALLGRAAGVQVTTSSGQPGAGAAVRIRGGNSVGASNEPLYVVDGVPVTTNLNEAATGNLYSNQRASNPIASINPNDIESVDVLKDASSTAIYGARAANGVVLITTKRGRQGQRSINFNTFYGTQQVRRTLPLLNARQFAEFVNEAYVNGGSEAPFTPDEVAALGSGTDWQDQIFRDSPVASAQISFAGGDADTKYYLSGDVLQNEGVVIGSDFNRKSFRLNLDQQFSSRFRIGNNLTFSRTDARVMPNGGAGSDASSIVLNALRAPPTIPVRTETGEYFIGVNPITGRAFNNPVAAALEITNEERQNRLIGSGFAEYDLLSGLTLRSTLGIDFFDSLQDFYSPVTTVPGSLTSGQGRRGQAQTTVWLNENTLTYNRSFSDVHSLNLVGGLTFQRSRGDWVAAEGREFATDVLRQNNLGSAGAFYSIGTQAPNWSLLSYLARANYGFRDRYLFTLTGRVDGSSRFGEDNRYAVFPSAAFAWRASEEDFIQRLGTFDDLKLRVSYGRTGNQDIGNYRSLATIGSANYIFNGARAVGFGPGAFGSNIANPELKWETTDQFDAGIDVSVLNNRIGLTADWYTKTTDDLLLEVDIPGTSGFSSSLQNVGSVRNRGFELAVNTVNLTGALGWDTQLNLAWNRNEVVDLGPKTEIFPGGVGAGANQDPTIVRVGEPINSFYGFVYAGLDDEGQPSYADLNGDGEVTPADRRIIGSAQPNYTGGLTNRFTFRNLELSVFLQWSVGNDIYNINRSILTDAAGTSNQLTDVLNAGQGEIPVPKTGNTFETTPSTLFVEDGTYFRGKNIRLSYTLPSALLTRLPLGRLSNLQLYVSAQNFFTVTDYTGFDPEITEYGGTNLQQGFDFGTYPQTRQFTIGFNAGL